MKKFVINLVLTLICSAAVVRAATVEVDVSPCNLDGWTPSATGSSSLNFVNGPATPPCGTGSAEFRIDSTGASNATLANVNYNNTMLSDLTALSYNTFVSSAPSSGGQAVFIALSLDLDGNGSVDDTIYFEPRLQGTTVTLNTWQSWNALTGLWWSQNSIAGATQAAPKSLADYLAAHPNARIVNLSTGVGGVQLIAGNGGAGDWGNFVGNADCFTIGVSGGDTTTFDFELDADNDGVPDNIDQCCDSDLRPKVDVNGTDPGVTSINNTVNAQGCSIQDLVNQCANGVKNHGQYVSCIAHLANNLAKAKTITKAQATEMKTGAAQSSIGKK